MSCSKKSSRPSSTPVYLVVCLGIVLATFPPIVRAGDEAGITGQGFLLDIQRKSHEIFHKLVGTYWFMQPYKIVDQLVTRHEDSRAVISAMNLEPGEIVADVGCGIGYYTFRFAHDVGPTGKVFALDIQKRALDFLRWRLKDELYNPYGNIEVILSELDSTTLQPDSVDVVALSHLDFPAQTNLLEENVRLLENCYEITRPGGKAMVLQYMDTDPRGTPEAITTNFTNAGFVQESMTHFEAKDSYLFIFRKPPALPDQPRVPANPDSQEPEQTAGPAHVK